MKNIQAVEVDEIGVLDANFAVGDGVTTFDGAVTLAMAHKIDSYEERLETISSDIENIADLIAH